MRQKKSLLFFLILNLFFSFSLTSHGWQGRMAGAGDAYGLIEDESDYLTHPAVIAMSKGFNTYGHYRLTYDKTTKWDYSVTQPASPYIYPYEANGDQWKQEGQIGAAFQVGAGRLGIFFDYVGVKGRYHGSENYYEHEGDEPGYLTFNLRDDLSNYALRFIYGVPVGSIKLGTEVQIVYVDEEKRVVGNEEGNIFINPYSAADDYPQYSFFPYMIPYKSKYWEAQGKVSLTGYIGAAKYAFTMKGGLPFASDNNYVVTSYEAEGKIKGFNAGGDFWLRVPVTSKVALPFLVSAGYKKMKRDGSFYDVSGPTSYEFENEAENIFVQVGGGVDVNLANGTRLAAGIYYLYLRVKQDAFLNEMGDTFYHYEYSDMPLQDEHRLTLKLLAEKELTQALVLRGGLNAFFGFVESDYAYSGFEDTPLVYGPFNASSDGYVWGLNAAIGANFKLSSAMLEPFLNGGFIQFRTDGDGILGPGPYIGGPYNIKTDFKKNNWHVGGGLSVKF